MLFDLSLCLGRIGYLAALRNARSYLEIGVRAGDTFFNIAAPLKVAVDPMFQFDPADHAEPGAYYFSLPSNIFFRKLKRGELGIKSERDPLTFDLIFIDGLHTYEQSYRDFLNSLDFAHENTVWVLDDTIPCDEFSAIPDMEASFAARKEAGARGLPWHGDVYKTVLAIHDNHPEFSYCTLMGENPQTVVWRAEKSARAPVFSRPEAITQVGFYDLLGLGVTMMPVEDLQLPEYLGRSLDPRKELDPKDNSMTRRFSLGIRS